MQQISAKMQHKLAWTEWTDVVEAPHHFGAKIVTTSEARNLEFPWPISILEKNISEREMCIGQVRFLLNS